MMLLKPTCGSYHQGLCLWSMLSPETMWKPMMVLTLTVKSKEAAFAMVSMTADAQLQKMSMEDFSDNPYRFLNLHQPKRSSVTA